MLMTGSCRSSGTAGISEGMLLVQVHLHLTVSSLFHPRMVQRLTRIHRSLTRVDAQEVLEKILE